MFDWVPARAWLLLLIALFAVMPARYIVRHLLHAPRRRDITLPPEDVSWRSSSRLAWCVAAVIAAGALAVFIFTPTAERFAAGQHFVPLLLVGMGVGLLAYVAHGFVTGSTSPMTRGRIGPYTLADQPKRFYASLIWNGIWSCGMFVFAGLAFSDARSDGLVAQCYDEEGALSYEGQIAACTTLIDRGDTDDPTTLGAYYSLRGYAADRLEHHEQALADYTRAVELNPADPEAHYNRAIIYRSDERFREALQDLNAAIVARPNWADAYDFRAQIDHALRDEP